MAPTKPIRLMLLDDHTFILLGMQVMLKEEADMDILGGFTSSASLVNALGEQAVDVVVMDYSLCPGEIDGLNLIRALSVRFPKIKLLVISGLHTKATVAMALRCGAKGFVGKTLDIRELAVAIRKVAAGKIYLHEDMAEELREDEVALEQVPAGTSKNTGGSLIEVAKQSGLTVREHEVLRCCLAGMSVTRIAEKYSRSIKTISTQKQSAYRKLGVSSDQELNKVRYQVEGR